MIDIYEKYRLGEVCVQLRITFKQGASVKQVENSLAPLLPFRSNDCPGETLNLHITDFEFVPKNKEYLTLLSMPKAKKSKLKIPSLFCLPKEEPHDFFVVSKDQKELNQLQLFFTLFVAAWWHELNNGLFLHAAAVSRNNQGFLFLGESGAGKSTVSSLSAELSIPVLAEDRVFLLGQQNRYSLAAGPHANTNYTDHTNLRPNLSGIFILIKDEVEYLKPIPHSETSKLLFAALLQTLLRGSFPDNAMAASFRTIANVARQIPAFELHFRKRPDFWNLIDERFPG
jgi:hypothetical protein